MTHGVRRGTGRLARLGAALFVCLGSGLLTPLHAIASAPRTQLADPITQAIVDSVIQTFTDWVAAGATWILGQVVALVQQGSAVNLNGGWFQQHYKTMIALSLMIMAPLLLCAAVKAAIAGDPGIAIKAAFVFLPLAMFGTFAATQIVNALLGLVDWASAAMTTTLNADYQAFAQNISTALSGGSTGPSIAAPFVIFICAIFMVVFGLLVFIELLFRNAAIYATAVFIPLAMATLIFPSTGKIAKRLIEMLIGLIMLKFFIVAVLSVGVSALGSGNNGGGFSVVLAGIVVLILAAVLPNLLIGLLPLVEGAAMATIMARTQVSQQIVQPTSNQIYSQIRRQNEVRATRMTSADLGAGFAGGAAGIGLLGASNATRHVHAPSMPVAAGKFGSGMGGTGVVPLVGAGGALAGTKAAPPSASFITGLSGKRGGGGASP